MTAQVLDRVAEVLGRLEESAMRVKLLRALIWAKLLYTPYAAVTYPELDYNMATLRAYAETEEEHAWVADGDSVVIPMETTTGTVEAEVDVG